MREIGLETALGAGMALLLLFVGFYLTWKLRAVQLRRFFSAFHGLTGGKRRGISAFSAACTNLGATVGMGNVLGVASGIAIGGPGSLFWMLFAAFFGMAIRWLENVLGARYRVRTQKGNYGGPFCYIERFLPRFGGPAARFYAFICVFGSAFGMGVMLQSRCIRTAWSAWTGETASAVCLLAAALLLLTAPVLLGGAKRIAKTAERLVPIMTVGYLLCCSWILFRFRAELPGAIAAVFAGAFRFRSAAGTSLGLLLRDTVLTGVRRGLFSNEAGLGLGAITAAAAEDADPEKLGDAGLVVTFLDTFVICLVSGLCVLVTHSAGDGSLLPDAWRRGIPWAGNAAPAAFTAFLTLFALTSIYGAGFSAESALRFLGFERRLRIFRFLCLAAVAVGVFLPQDILWRGADLTNALLAVPNLLALFFSSFRMKTHASNAI